MIHFFETGSAYFFRQKGDKVTGPLETVTVVGQTNGVRLYKRTWKTYKIYM
jgi:hypothetical protein